MINSFNIYNKSYKSGTIIISILYIRKPKVQDQLLWEPTTKNTII